MIQIISKESFLPMKPEWSLIQRDEGVIKVKINSIIFLIRNSEKFGLKFCRRVVPFEIQPKKKNFKAYT